MPRLEGSFLTLETRLMCYLSAAMVEAFQRPLSYRNCSPRRTVDTYIQHGRAEFGHFLEQAHGNNRLTVSSTPLMDTHVNTSRSVIPEPQDKRHSSDVLGYQVSSRQRAGYERRVKPTAVEWGGQATERKLFPATAILGVSETGNQAAYTGCSFSLCFFPSPQITTLEFSTSL